MANQSASSQPEWVPHKFGVFFVLLALLLASQGTSDRVQAAAVTVAAEMDHPPLVAASLSGQPAEIESPALGSTLPGSIATFSWSAGTHVGKYWVYLGNSIGAYDIASVDFGMALSGTITGIPTDGRKV